MHSEQIASPPNGHPKIYPASETDAPTKNIATVSTERLEIQQEHHDWLNKARKRQVKNRRMLALISRIESILLDRDAKMVSLVARIEAHEAEANSMQMAQQIQPTPTYDRYHNEHAAVREIFNHLERNEEQFKTQIKDVIEALLRTL